MNHENLSASAKNLGITPDDEGMSTKELSDIQGRADRLSKSFASQDSPALAQMFANIGRRLAMEKNRPLDTSRN